MLYNDWEMVCGLEIHAQLNTSSKIFSPESALFGGADNQNVHPITLGMPGCLPLLNEKAVELAIKTGLALGCEINEVSRFARKNYFYPDSPKGYQISQFEQPICGPGEIEFQVEDYIKKVRIERAHMEEDAGKSSHLGDSTLINLNRVGVPLLEIVSQPDISSPSEAAEYARTIRQILRYIGVCDGNLEEGSMRCDCNVSIRKKGDKKLGTRTEIKNVNSFRFVQKSIEYEVQRQIDLVESGGQVVQETRLWDSSANKTVSMRAKEDANDYRYFPDPDLLPLVVAPETIEHIKKQIPELPRPRAERFQNEFLLTQKEAVSLTQERAQADYFEAVVQNGASPKAASSWIMTELLRELNAAELEFEAIKLRPENLAKLIKLVEKGTLSRNSAKKVFQVLWSENKDPEVVVEQLGLVQITDSSAIEKVINEVINNNPKQAEQYRSGKLKVFGFFVGQVMKATNGQASPEVVNSLLKTKLGAK